MAEESFDEAGTAIIVLIQMLVSFLGIITNSLLLVTVNELSSTYHVLLANLSFSNLFVCTVLKPVTSIYSGYAYAKMQHRVGLSFCQLYTFLTGTFLPILPWSVLALAWQVLLQGRTNIKLKTSTNTPNRVLSKRGQRKFLQFREMKSSAVESDHINMSIKKNESKKNKEELNPDQLFILLII